MLVKIFKFMFVEIEKGSLHKAVHIVEYIQEILSVSSI